MPLPGAMSTRTLPTAPNWTLPTTAYATLDLRRDGERSSVVEYEPSSGRSRVAYPVPLHPGTRLPAIGHRSLASDRNVFVEHRVRLESALVLVENFQ